MPQDAFQAESEGRLSIHGFVRGSRGEVPISILVDTGCDVSCIASDSAKRLGLRTRRMAEPVFSSLADGSLSKVEHESELEFRVDSYTSTVYVTIINGSLQPHDMLLGMDWMIKADPKVSFNPLSFRVRSGGREHELNAVRPEGEPFFCGSHGYADPKGHPQSGGGRYREPREISSGMFGGRGGGHDHGHHCDDCDGSDGGSEGDDYDDLMEALAQKLQQFGHGHGHSPFWEDFGHGRGYGMPVCARLSAGHRSGCHSKGRRRRTHASHGGGGHSRSRGHHHGRAVVCAAKKNTVEPKKKWHDWREVFGLGRKETSKKCKSSSDGLKIYKMSAVKPLAERGRARH